MKSHIGVTATAIVSSENKINIRWCLKVLVKFIMFVVNKDQEKAAIKALYYAFS